MKRLVLIIALFSFLAGGIAEMAHAAVPELSCAHHTSDTENVDQDCASGEDQDQIDFEQCQDCCCHHTHVIAKIAPNATTRLNVKAGVVLMPNEAPRSRTLSPLYRPPIV